MSDKIYRVSQVRAYTENISQILLYTEDADPLVYQAGQYVKVVHPDQNLSPLSIAKAPQDLKVLELHLFHPVQNARAQEILRMVREEGRLLLRGPFGEATTEALLPEQPIIFLAGGTGFAPIKAMIEALSQQAACPAMHLYWSVSQEKELYLYPLVKTWEKTVPGFRFTAVLTREEGEEPKMRAIPRVVLEDYPDLSDYQVYASGPRSMIYAALYAFLQRGMAREAFYTDVFE